MAMEAIEKEYPELQEAIAYAMRFVAEERPSDPIKADKMLEYHSNMHGAAGGAASASSGALDEDDEDTKRMRARQAARGGQGKGRRNVVFAEPVKLDADWKPTVIPKSDSERAEIEAIITKNILFQSADEEQSAILLGAMASKSFSAGDIIIRQGDPGDFYYVLVEGTCDILVNGKLVVKTSKGMGFGELALLYDAPRAATVVATSPVRAWAIDRVTFKQVMIGTTMKKRDLYESFLRGVPILAMLTTDEILTIADALVPVKVAAGSPVVVQGDVHADRFYIVDDGELKAEIAGIEGEVCARLKRGSYFGERALIKDEPRAATVTAVVDSKCLAMDRAAFLRLLGPITDLLQRNLELYSKYTTGGAAAASTESDPGMAQ